MIMARTEKKLPPIPQHLPHPLNLLEGDHADPIETPEEIVHRLSWEKKELEKRNAKLSKEIEKVHREKEELEKENARRREEIGELRRVVLHRAQDIEVHASKKEEAFVSFVRGIQNALKTYVSEDNRLLGAGQTDITVYAEAPGGFI